MKIVNYVLLLSMLFSYSYNLCSSPEEWVTILVHGIVGFGANCVSRTIHLAKYDQIEGSKYERQVTRLREHPYLFTIQPIGKLGLHPVVKPTKVVNGAYAFSVLYTDLMDRFLKKENNTFYTYGWSGLISKKRREREGRRFYQELREFILDKAAQGTVPKIRLIGYSHGATMFLNFAEYREKEFPDDTFMIDETFFLGTPMNSFLKKPISQAPFKQVYNIYSRSDKVQRLDIFTGGKPFSQRALKGSTPPNLKQIEIRITGPLNKLPKQKLPSSMRGTINQSPGHVELWSFGWTSSLYRNNLIWYPVCGGVFIPYLVHAARSLPNKHTQVDIRLNEGMSIVSAICGSGQCCVPFMSEGQFAAFIKKAYEFHPSKTQFLKEFVRLQETVDIKAYK